VLGVAPTTVAKWCKKHGVKPGATIAPPAVLEAARKRAADPPEPDIDIDDVPDDGDELSALRRMRNQMISDAKQARLVGAITVAQRSLTAAATLSPTIARLEKASKDDAGVLHLSRAAIASAEASLLEKQKALLARPLLCAECGRKFSIAWAEGESEPHSPSTAAK